MKRRTESKDIGSILFIRIHFHMCGSQKPEYPQLEPHMADVIRVQYNTITWGGIEFGDICGIGGN